ncbi:Vegetative incompatibility protein HET-E-1 [Fulvia fulva]|uniref:Vegetative incompatibility protein HET-E-1 n=1 Tax=Passalora fulva TaxID=5499 RepID=A0A9Q8PM78_PASFU|nr:Vegetative incompatibility protein HET-E-1 [Fulvia fulva]UJO24949.1 Vegetative incompatibility protein HET-E-1 [Fulvia fulva]WPV22677.1 Vegetative incompatibility protein HET-E-1 [Fulvia fulva]
MRLIHTTDLYLRSFSQNIPKYAILSHRWAENDDDEVTFRQFCRKDNTTSTGHLKIERACALARSGGIEWLWVDTCCIDASSSAELSEAINPMFAWYRDSTICYAFLTDQDVRYFEPLPNHVPFIYSHEAAAQANYSPVDADFSTSWFGRGWTLQELLAPRAMQFYHTASDPSIKPLPLGTKSSLCNILSSIAGIERAFLSGHTSLSTASVSKRMYWASRRRTTRTEDIAYCLLGLFDVNMSLLYGEGAKAFTRLQEAIIAQSDDETIFAWTALVESTKNPWSAQQGLAPRGMLANSPAEFWRFPCLRRGREFYDRPPYRTTNRGLEFPIAIDSMRTLLSSSLYGRVILAAGEADVLVSLQCTCDCRGAGDGGSFAVLMCREAQDQGRQGLDPASPQGIWSRRSALKLFWHTPKWLFRFPMGHHLIHVAAPSQARTVRTTNHRDLEKLTPYRPAGMILSMTRSSCASSLLLMSCFEHVLGPLLTLNIYLVGWSMAGYSLLYLGLGALLSSTGVLQRVDNIGMMISLVLAAWQLPYVAMRYATETGMYWKSVRRGDTNGSGRGRSGHVPRSLRELYLNGHLLVMIFFGATACSLMLVNYFVREGRVPDTGSYA